MFVLKFFFRLLKVMNSETSPRSLGAAFALGVLLGLVPLGTLQGVLLLCVVLFMRVNLTAALAMFLVTRVAAPLYRDGLHHLGAKWLESPALEDFWRWVTNDPFLSLADLGHTVTLAGTVVGLLALVPLWMFGSWAVRSYRDRLEDRLIHSAPFRYVRSLKIVAMYRTLTGPFG